MKAPLLAMLGSALMGALVIIGLRHATAGQPEWSVAAQLNLAAMAALLLTLAAQGKLALLKGALHPLVLARGLLSAAAMALFLISLKRLSSAEAAVIQYTFPLFTGLACWLLDQEAPSGKFLGGCAIALLGVGAISGANASGTGMYCAIALAGAMAAGAAGALIGKVAPLADPRALLIATQGLCLIFCAPAAIASSRTPAVTFNAPLLITGIGLAASQLLMIYAYVSGPLTRLSTVNYLTPLLVCLIEATALGRGISAVSGLGLLAVLGGVWVGTSPGGWHKN